MRRFTKMSLRHVSLDFLLKAVRDCRIKDFFKKIEKLLVLFIYTSIDKPLAAFPNLYIFKSLYKCNGSDNSLPKLLKHIDFNVLFQEIPFAPDRLFQGRSDGRSVGTVKEAVAPTTSFISYYFVQFLK